MTFYFQMGYGNKTKLMNPALCVFALGGGYFSPPAKCGVYVYTQTTQVAPSQIAFCRFWQVAVKFLEDIPR